MATILDQNNKNKTTALGMGGNVATPSNTAMTGIQNKPASSGAFTNLQSYMAHNKLAGQQIGQKLGQNVQAGLNVQQEKAKTGVSGLGEQVSTGQQKMAQGQEVLSKIKGAGPLVGTDQYTPQTTSTMGIQGITAGEYKENIPSIITDIAQDPEKLAQIQGLRTGTTQTNVQKAMEDANQLAMQRMAQYGALQQQRSSQIGSEAGRQGLLSEFLGKGKYGRGTSALDQAFLQQQAPQVLTGIQRQIGQQGNVLQGLSGNVLNLGQEAQTVNLSGTGLSKDITSELQGKTQELTDVLNKRAKDIDIARTAASKKLTEDYAKFQAGEEISPELASMLGLQGGERLYNLNQQDMSKVIKGVDDLKKMTGGVGAAAATQADVDYSKALAALSGGEQLYTKASDLKAGLTSDFAKDLAEKTKQIESTFGNIGFAGYGSADQGAGAEQYAINAPTPEMYTGGTSNISSPLTDSNTQSDLARLAKGVAIKNAPILAAASGLLKDPARQATGKATLSLADYIAGKSADLSHIGERNIDQARFMAEQQARQAAENYLKNLGYYNTSKVAKK